LGRTEGDLCDGQRLSSLASPMSGASFVGPVWLGEEHQGLGTVYFGRHQSRGGVGVILRLVRVVGNADEIVGRRLHGRGSSLRYSPRQRGDPPPWAGSA
jgi:hypothetical protein